MRRPLLSAAVLAAALLARPAPAQEIVLGLGVDDVLGGVHPAFAAEYRLAPFATLGPTALGLAAAAEADVDGDLWGGAGVAFVWPFRPGWRFEASLMAGGYARASDDDLGTDAPIFRSQVGASMEVSPPWRAGVAVNHKSNAGIASPNPGIETVLFTLGRPL